MSNVRIELNSEGIKEVLKSAEVMAECRSYAEQIAASVGNGYEVNEYTGATRVNVSVRTVDDAAAKDNLENNTLLKAVN